MYFVGWRTQEGAECGATLDSLTLADLKFYFDPTARFAWVTGTCGFDYPGPDWQPIVRGHIAKDTSNDYA